MRSLHWLLAVIMGVALLGVQLPVAASDDARMSVAAVPQGQPDAAVPLAQSTPEYPIFGIETNSGRLSNSTVTRRAGELGATWVRLNTLSWRDIQLEPDTPPEQWNWQAKSVQTFEAELAAAAAANLVPMVIVDDYPRWATIEPNACSEIRADRFDDYGRFLAELVKRYKAAPYNVRHWELGNEVDIDPSRVFVDNFFGCWGDIDDPYYNGESYGEMLKVVAPAMRAADPNVRIIIGGLLLDRPDTRIVGWGKPERFFEGILRAGAADSFDMVGVHAYPWFQGVEIDSDLVDPRWINWGGMTFGKVQFLRNVMQQYGVDKPIVMNETSLLLGQDFHNETFYDAQANHLVRTTLRALSVGVQAYCWYTFHESGWLSAGLLDRSNNPRTNYRAYQELIKQAGSVRTVQRITNYGDAVEAYRFDQGARYVDVLWSRDGVADQVSILKPAFLAAYTRNGATLEPQLTPAAAVVTVSYSPVYIHSLPVATEQVPQLTSVRPNEGNNARVTRITLSGSNFIAPVRVQLGSTLLGNVRFVNSTTIEADVPAGLPVGSYDVTVINPGDWAATRTRVFTVLSSSPPTITEVRPTAGHALRSQRIHVFGSNFASGVQVQLGTIPLTVRRISGAHLVVEMPASAATVGVYDLVVINPDQGRASRSAAFEVFLANQGVLDLRGDAATLATDPATVRSGQRTTVSQVVERVGSTLPLTVAVRLTASGPNGAVMNAATPAVPFGTGATAQVVVGSRVFPTVGDYVLQAQLDPNQALAERDEKNNIITRTIRVLGRDVDEVRPTIRTVVLNGGAVDTSDPVVFIGLDLSDPAPSSGITSIYIAEYEYNWGADQWIVTQQSQAWQPYRSGQTPTWTLIPTAGLKVLRVWAADAAGNVSQAATATINYTPELITTLAGGVQIYRYPVKKDETLQLTIEPLGGTVDFYVWSPDAPATLATSGRTDAAYTVGVVAGSNGTYQVEIHGASAPSYRLRFQRLAAAPALQAVTQPNPLRDAPVVTPNAVPFDSMVLPPALTQERQFVQVWLPLIRR